MVYEIGTFNFVVFNRPGGRGEGPELLGQEQVIISYPGTDGLNVRREGTKGRVFQVRSVAVFATQTEALNEQLEYRLSQSEVATLQWESIDYTNLYGIGYLILNVSEPNLTRLGAAAYLGADVTNWWKLESTWELLPVDSALVPKQPAP